MSLERLAVISDEVTHGDPIILSLLAEYPELRGCDLLIDNDPREPDVKKPEACLYSVLSGRTTPRARRWELIRGGRDA